ncbi:LOW QUALITY PROTEIN: E3 ubiquitin-protein ligase TRIM38-like [Pungitius pungitius]|uniref:LOW QUALITY PROTEIN: E3 ubiquitin-protein ligase TRIM38-like n=1 Tax=Pungitius pungitius TaxID=134920 RepID=UPI002E0FA6DB
MATASCLRSEDKFLCSVCLEVLTEPVSTPCGHNFCSACIHTYWDGSDICQCPLCKRSFPQKPELQVNTFLSELAAEFKALLQVEASTPEPRLPGTADVLCDICSEMRANAAKSCLTCLASFCEAHLQPHRRVAGLKGHTILDPVKNLDDRVCKTHSRVTELYCRTDRAFVCASCLTADHESHKVVSLDEEYHATVAKLDETQSNIQKMTQSRYEKIAEIQKSIGVGQTAAEEEKEASERVFQDLIRSLQSNRAELVSEIEEHHRKTKQKAEDLIGQLRMEVADLESRGEQLEQLSQSKDHHHVLQSFLTTWPPPDAHPADRADIWAHSDPSFQAVRGTVTQVKRRLDQITEELPENKMKRMKRMREHAVNLTFDPDTANCSLVVSQDGKQVVSGGTKQKLRFNPKRFRRFQCVLAKEGFTAGKFYYEVQVEGHTEWNVGVVGESIDRGEDMFMETGVWIIGLNQGIYMVFTSHFSELKWKEKLRKVGIFVDYNERVVSFFDANTKSRIYSFTGCTFTEKLYPFFCSENTDGVPLILTPIPQND